MFEKDHIAKIPCKCTVKVIDNVQKPTHRQVQIIDVQNGCYHQHGDIVIKNTDNFSQFGELNYEVHYKNCRSSSL